MNNQTLVIYDYEIFYEMLYELKKNLNFNIINISKNRKLDRIYLNDSNYLIISKKNFL